MAEIHRKRKRNLTVFLSDEERAMLDAKADDLDLSKAEYIRDIILFGSIQERTVFSREEAQSILSKLKGVGDNVNELAREANITRIVDYNIYSKLVENYMELLSIYDEFMRGKKFDLD
jgi:Ribbon-helix-helix protein, copG family.